MSTEVGVLRGVSWRDCCPWLILTQTVRLATSTQLVVLAFVGVVAVSIGWQLCGAMFLPANLAETDPATALAHQWLARWPGGQGPVVGLARATGLPRGETAPFDPVVDVPFRMAEPLRRVLDPTISWRNLAYYLSGGLWTVAVWALFGGAITRTAVVRLGIEERVGLRESLKFAGRKWAAFFAAPVLPLIGIALLACPMLVLGLLMRADVGVVLAAPLWLLVLLSRVCHGDSGDRASVRLAADVGHDRRREFRRL